MLLVVVDTLRADHTSVHGYERDTTPRLRALADEGVRFERAYAPVGLTAPTHASLFTALHPLTHGLVRNGLSLGSEHVTLAEYLAVRGYQTAGVASSFVLHRRFGMGQGFAYYDDAFDPAEATVALDEWEGHAVEEGFDRRADHTTRRAVRWLRERRNPASPFFLFVHYFDPHAPYEPVPAYADRFTAGAAGELEREIAAYDAEIAFTDAAIGELLDALQELDLARDTVVIVTADHGEGLMQRGYMLHGLSVHEEEVRVPLVVRWPGRVRAGGVVPEPVSLLDVAPTVMHLVGVSVQGGAFEGQSLAGTLRDGAPLDPQRPVFVYRRDFGPARQRPVVLGGGEGEPTETFEVAGAQSGVRAGRWKYVQAPAEAPPALYDLDTDPGERENAARRHPQQAERLAALLERWLRAHPTPQAEPGGPSELDRARLRALGYAE
ncbi:MAG: sulfatase [Myxococcota bacterium]|nr:sulfatase [Myxococcota bacterium]